MPKRPTLTVSPFPARNCWRKVIHGVQHYFKHPLTRAGEQAALLELAELLKQIDRERPNATRFHDQRDFFEKVKAYYDHFDTPIDERSIAKQVSGYLKWLLLAMKNNDLPESPLKAFGDDGTLRKEFFSGAKTVSEHGSFSVEKSGFMSPKWEERLRQLDARQAVAKEPQTVGYWLEAYERRTRERSLHAITVRSAADRSFKLNFYKKWADLSGHVSVVNHDHVEKFHAALSHAKLAKASKDDYWRVWRMFVRWASKHPGCEMKLPSNIDERELRFREPDGTGRKRQAKRERLWTVDEFKQLLDFPNPFPCFALLYLNCGFRATDVNSIRKSDIDLIAGRIIWQRKKTDQLRSPVVNYKLWPQTVEAIKSIWSDHSIYAFADDDTSDCYIDPTRFLKEKRTSNGEIRCWDALSSRFRGSRKRGRKHGIAKTMDFIRKTGASLIEARFRGVETVYLGDSLKGVPAIHYVFRDGEILPELDAAIDYLGQHFGFLEPPATLTVSVPAATIAKLKAKGMTLEQVIASI